MINTKHVFSGSLLLILLIVLAIPNSILHAQCEGDCEQPIVFSEDGTIIACYPSTGEGVILVDDVASDGVAYSPSGEYIAFRSEAAGVGEAFAENLVHLPSQRPSDIWLWPVGTDDIILIAGQPENATISEAIGFEHMIERSVPIWSPDGLYLAWSAFDLDEWTYQVMVYSFEEDTIEVLLENPPSGFQDVVFYPYPPLWGEGGIVFVQPNVVGGGDGPPSFRDVVTIFDPEDGSEIYSGVVTDNDSDSIRNWVWINDGETLALAYGDEHWEALDLESGERTLIDNPVPPSEEEPDLGLCSTE